MILRKQRRRENRWHASISREQCLCPKRLADICRKESHITTFVHLLLASGLPFTNVRIPELDYCSHCTIELWEKSSGNASARGQKEFSIRLSISEGAHSPAVLDSNVDAVSLRQRVCR